jgi:hypothetical protein
MLATKQPRTQPCYKCGMTFRIGRPFFERGSRATICATPQCGKRCFFSDGAVRAGHKAIVWVRHSDAE